MLLSSRDSATLVHRPVPPDNERLETLLGTAPLPIQQRRAPWITVAGRNHEAASTWLALKALETDVEATVLSHAGRLADWIRFLRDERGLVGHDERSSDVFVATEADFQEYYAVRQARHASALSPTRWRALRSSIKQFHEWLHRRYGTALPFRIKRLATERWRGTAIVGYSAKANVRSRGTPITPEFLSLLVAGAGRYYASGDQALSLAPERDSAFVSLGAASGMRLNSLVHVTTYEIPPAFDGPFSTILIPSAPAKGYAGSEALAFEHLLTSVRDYIDGAREELLERGRPWTPPDAIWIAEADEHGWREHQGRGTIAWDDTDEITRRRLVNPDGSTPLLFLCADRATPITYATGARITAAARKWVREHLEPNFPAAFRTHDLRHTYAVHLTVCIAKGAVNLHNPWQTDGVGEPIEVAAAVDLAQSSLGHASDESTALYTKHAYKFLHLPVEAFIGKSR